jgi:hypothetical protein
MKSCIFLDITTYNLLKVNRRFGGTCRLHVQSRRIRQERNKREADSKQSWRWEDTFLRYFGWLSTDFTMRYPHNHLCDSLKSNKNLLLLRSITNHKTVDVAVTWRVRIQVNFFQKSFPCKKIRDRDSNGYVIFIHFSLTKHVIKHIKAAHGQSTKLETNET